MANVTFYFLLVTLSVCYTLSISYPESRFKYKRLQKDDDLLKKDDDDILLKDEAIFVNDHDFDDLLEDDDFQILDNEVVDSSQFSHRHKNKFYCKESYGRFPDPSDCQHFYECKNWSPRHQKCGREELFDPEKLKCNKKKYVKCKGSKDSSSESSEDSDEDKKPTAFRCRYPYGPHPNPDDCSKWYLCLNGKPQSRKCGRGKLYDIRAKNCLPEKLVNCEDRENPNVKTTKSSTAVTASTKVKTTKSAKSTTGLPDFRSTASSDDIKTEFSTAVTEGKTGGDVTTMNPQNTDSDSNTDESVTSSDGNDGKEGTGSDFSTHMTGNSEITTNVAESQTPSDVTVDVTGLKTSSDIDVSVTEDKTSDDIDVTNGRTSSHDTTGITEDQSNSDMTKTEEETVNTNEPGTHTNVEITQTNKITDATELQTASDVDNDATKLSSDGDITDTQTLSTVDTDKPQTASDIDITQTSEITDATKLQTMTDENDEGTSEDKGITETQTSSELQTNADTTGNDESTEVTNLQTGTDVDATKTEESTEGTKSSNEIGTETQTASNTNTGEPQTISDIDVTETKQNTDVTTLQTSDGSGDGNGDESSFSTDIMKTQTPSEMSTDEPQTISIIDEDQTDISETTRLQTASEENSQRTESTSNEIITEAKTSSDIETSKPETTQETETPIIASTETTADTDISAEITTKETEISETTTKLVPSPKEIDISSTVDPEKTRDCTNGGKRVLENYKCPEHNGHFPHPYCDNLFIHCDEERAFVKKCADGLKFSPEHLVCVWDDDY